jgi:hypothetical protein
MEMKKLIYWMTFQVLVGIWLFISPFVLGYKEETAVAANNMLFGVMVVLFGLGVSLYAYYRDERHRNLDETLHLHTGFSLRKL